MKRKYWLILFLIIVVAFLAGLTFKNKEEKTKMPAGIEEPLDENDALESESTNAVESVPMEIDQSKKYTAVVDTSRGEIKIELFADKTPITVNNFISLSRKDFYNGTIFHRVINGFMIQGGDPNGDGTGGPGYRFDDEPFEGNYSRGTLAMANAGPNTNGSQFFIMHQDYDLPPNYVIFGRVVEGIEVVDEIAASVVKPGPSGENSSPVEPTVINSVEIIEE